jgi:hypothetical protein
MPCSRATDRLQRWDLLPLLLHQRELVPSRLLLQDTGQKGGMLAEALLSARIDGCCSVSGRILLHHIVDNRGVHLAVLLPRRLYPAAGLPCSIAVPRPCGGTGAVLCGLLLPLGRNGGRLVPARVLLPDSHSAPGLPAAAILPRRLVSASTLP